MPATAYPNLEPNHSLEPNEDGDLVLLCPFEPVDGVIKLRERPVTQTALWAKEAEPSEIECPVCEVFNGQIHYIGSPDCSDAVD